MNWKLSAILFSALLLNPVTTPVADACGVKLTVKSGGPRRAVARTSNPSDVLLLGKPPRRLERDLVEAGHRVDVAKTSADAKPKRYAVVVADNDQEAEAHARFPGAKVIVRSSDPGQDARSVEGVVGRTAVATSATTAVASRERRRPVDVGGDTTVRGPVAAGGTGTASADIVASAETPKAEVKVEPPKAEVKAEAKIEPPKAEAKVEAKVEPKVVATAEPKHTPKVEAKTEQKIEKAEPKVEVAKAEPPAPKAAAVRSFANGEMYFAVGVDSLNTHHASLDKAAKWLAASPDVNVVIEGHADPTGNSDANMALSEKRAEWVKDQLVARGIDASRLEVKGMGDTQLKYGRSDGRNRRVAIVPK